MKELFKKHPYFFEVIFILIVGLIPLLWYRSQTLGLGHDMGFPLAPIDYFKDRLFSWTDRVGPFGSNQTESLAGFFIHGLEALITFLGFSLIHTQQIAFIFWFTLPGLTMYILLRSLHPQKEDFIIRLSGSLFYMMNHYLLQGWMIAERTKFSIVAALPLVTLFIINVVYKRQSVLKNSILLSIVLLFLNGGAGIPLWGGLAVAALITLAVTLITSRESLFAKLKRVSGFIVISFVFVFLLNLYWTYPYLKSFSQNFTVRADSSGGGDGAARWSTEISKYASFTNIIKMQGIPDWYNNPENPYSNNFLNNYFLILLSIIFPLVGFAGLIKKREEPTSNFVYKINFLLILLIAIPLTAGSHSPTGALYDFALKHVPGFLIFRTPFLKWGMLIWFAYAYLIALGLKNLAEFLYPEISRILSKLTLQNAYILVFVIFAALLGIYNYPFFTGSFFDWSSKYSTKVAVPNYIFEAKKELDNNKFTTRALLLPYLDDQVKTDSYSWRYYSLSQLTSIFSRRPTVLNDVTMQGYEGTLVNAIYNQLENTGKSNLLAYAGIDRAIYRNDFSSPQNAAYSTLKIKLAVNNSLQPSSVKQIGQWNYLDITEGKTRPLIYTPQSISNLIIQPDHLSTALDFPGVHTLADALVFSDESNPTIKPEQAYQYIIEGKCIDCKAKVSSDPLDLKAPRILPGTKLDSVIKLMNQLRINRLNDPAQKIDFVLGTMAKNASAVGLLIGNAKNAQTVKEIIGGWSQSLNEIQGYYLSMGDDKKEQSAERIYRYLWFFILKSEEWRMYAGSADNINQLLTFEDLTRSYIQKLNLQPPKFDDQKQTKIGKYELSIPRKGIYKIGIHAPIIGNEVKKDNDKEKITEFGISFNNQQLDLTKTKEADRWLQSQELFLEAGDYSLVVPKIPNKIVYYPKISLKAPAAQSGCQEAKLADVNLGSQYKVTFNYESISRKHLSVKVIENDEQGNRLDYLKVQSQIGEVPGETPVYKNAFIYSAKKFTNSAVIQFCIDGNYTNSAEASVFGLAIEEIFPEPLVFAYSLDQFNQLPSANLEFVALNQTKYLIRTDSVTDDFMLIFNSRLDHNWKLREIDLRNTDKYFRGEKKEYLNGQVIEYPREDNHIITDLIFPTNNSNAINNTGLALNGFANSWNIDLTNNQKINDKRVFLLEYDVQNNVYAAAAVSVFVFINLIVLYFILNRYEKK